MACARHKPAPVPAWHHTGFPVRANQLTGNGRIYLIQLGNHTDPYTVVELAEWLRDKYALDVQVLTPTPLDPAAWDRSRHCYIAERISAQMKREHPVLAADRNAWLIGFTDEAMYSATEKQSNTFSQRDHFRAAVISSSGLGDSALLTAWERFAGIHDGAANHLQDRLRRILLKDVAVLFWHLPLNNDPGSILSASLDPSVPTNDLYQSDLDPVRSQWGQFVTDPCIVFTYTAADGVKRSPGPLIQQCLRPESADRPQTDLGDALVPPDITQERFELRLRYGLLTEKHTDFYLPGPIPIRFERAMTNRWLMPQAFGLSGSHNYDRYLTASDFMSRMRVVNPGSGDTALTRSPAWMILPPLSKWVDTDASGSNLALRWRALPSEHLELKRFNGEIESYMPCTDAQLCYLNGYRNSNGESLAMQRDSARRLLSLSSAQNQWLNFSYGAPRKRVLRQSKTARDAPFSIHTTAKAKWNGLRTPPERRLPTRGTISKTC